MRAMVLRLPPSNGGGLFLSASWNGDQIAVEATGEAGLRSVDTLHVFVSHLHEEALRLHASAITFDLRELTMMSASCVKVLVHWLIKVEGLEEKNQYAIRLLGNGSHHWQGISLAALRCFAANVVTLEID
jgi:hypothetical protein